MLARLKQGPVLIIIPLIIASFTLFFGLGTLYRNLISDERSFLLSSDLLRGYPYYPYLIWPNVGTTHTFLIYLLQIPLSILGYSVFALRLVPALFGLVGVVTFFILLKNLSDNFRIAALGATILSLMHWYLSISRVTIELSEFLFFGMVQLIFLTLFLKTRARKSLVYLFLTGLSFGLFQHTYQSARFFILFYLLFLPLYWLLNKTSFKEIFKQASVFLVGLLLAISPLIYVYLSHPNYFDSRRGELVFSQNLKPQELFWSLKQSTLRTLGMFHFRGSDVRCYNIPRSPMLDPITGILFVLGAVLSVRQLKREFSLLLGLFFLISLIPSILSYWPATPHGLRAAGSIIPVIIWVALGTEKLATLSRGRFSWIIALVILGAIGLLNIKSYFIDLAAVQDDCYQYSISSFDEYKKGFLDNTKGVKFIR